jgi:SAM-dependent methyltransferase
MATTHVDRHFARVAPYYQAVRITDEEPVVEVAASLPPRALWGLEVGCGTGRYTELLLRHLGSGSSIVAVDACWEMIERLRSKAKAGLDIRPVCGDAAALPFGGGDFDFAATFNAIHHFDVGGFLAGVARVLRPGGRLFVYTRTPEQNARSIWGRRFPGFREKETRLLSLDRLEEAVAKTAGLALVGAREYTFRRRESVAVLRARARAHSYSTFSLYGEEELAEALSRFLDSLPSDPVDWVDENTLVVAERR